MKIAGSREPPNQEVQGVEEDTMKRNRTFVVVAMAVSIVSAVALLAAARAAPTDYTIRITSGVPGKEVRFDAAVLVRNADSPLRTMNRLTPFEVRTTGYAASAMFRAVGDEKIQVELVGERDGRQTSRATASGRAVVVGNNLEKDEGGFITSF